MNSNATFPTTSRNPQRLLTAFMAGLCAFMVAGTASAQRVTDPQPKPAITKAPESGFPASRFIGPEEMESYLTKMRANLAMNGRTMDPFAQIQDPNAKPVESTTPKTPKRFTSAKPTSFTEIIGRIKVTTIMPSEDRFLVGPKSYKQGDRFNVTHKGRSTKVEVIAVEPLKIDFKNVETGEVASVKINLLPPGMQQGTDGISTPGMTADQKDTGIDVDSDSNF